MIYKRHFQTNRGEYASPSLCGKGIFLVSKRSKVTCHICLLLLERKRLALKKRKRLAKKALTRLAGCARLVVRVRG